LKDLLKRIILKLIDVLIVVLIKLKTNTMKNINDILNSDFWKENFQPEIDAEDAHLKENGWTRADIQAIADSVTKTTLKN
tara:strand:+ start:688 stop:927 length:240 start_codon:yes stop_codon:yes gene_type:complete